MDVFYAVNQYMVYGSITDTALSKPLQGISHIWIVLCVVGRKPEH